MNRQEAITAITDLISWLEGSPEEHGSTTYVYANDMREAVEALKPPTPDPDTGLLPCGCGSKHICVAEEKKGEI